MAGARTGEDGQLRLMVGTASPLLPLVVGGGVAGAVLLVEAFLSLGVVGGDHDAGDSRGDGTAAAGGVCEVLAGVACGLKRVSLAT